MARRKNFAQSLDDAYLECRVERHLPETEGSYYQGDQVWIVKKCARCETYIVYEWSKGSGVVAAHPKYYYPPGYMKPKGEEVLKKRDYRKERIKRMQFDGGGNEFQALLQNIAAEREAMGW